MDTVKYELREGWKFHLGECEEAWYKGYDDSGWRTVMLPHDWSVEAPFSRGYSSGTGYLQGGTGWYRVTFSLPQERKGMRVRLVFDGVYKNSQVWCNSYYLGKRPSGYATFSYDISPFVHWGETPNQISVKVSHTDIADSRWFTGSGITRKVMVVVEEPVHPAEYGCYFECGELEASARTGGRKADEQPERGVRAELKVHHEILNTEDRDVCVNVRTEWVDHQGNRAAEAAEDCEVKAQSAAGLTLCCDMKAPWLWSPEHPALYGMRTWYCVDGKEPYLVHEEKVGIRSIRFDAKEGFFLNGVSTKFKSVCVHHDGGCLGAAMKKEVWQRRLELLKECGCNAIRCSHNPHMPELYELCDSMGFLMMDEAFDEWENPKNKWSTGHNVYPPKHQGYYEDFPLWHEADLQAMIRRDRNHPSVVMWSIGNEIDYPNDPYCHPMFATMTGNNDANKPADERMFDENKPNAERLAVLAAELAAIVRKTDSTRPVTLAAAFPELSASLGFFDALDVAGYNYKEHLYEEDHRRFPGLPLLGSENGHSYQAWRAVTDNDYISGQFLWTGIDYMGEARGWPVHGSGAGIITTCGFPKPEFYRRKSFWTSQPVLQLATREFAEDMQDWTPMSYSWNYEPGAMILVKCYAKLQEKGCVVLSVNGRELGRQTDYQQDGAFAFKIPYEPGILEAKYYREDNTIAVQSALRTAGEPVSLSCELWQEPDRITGRSWEEAAGETGYLYQIQVTLKDAASEDVVWTEGIVKVQIEGAGELAGIDNGDLADVTPLRAQEKSTFGGKLMVYVRRTERGSIRVTLTAKRPDGSILEAGGRYEIQIP